MPCLKGKEEFQTSLPEISVLIAFVKGKGLRLYLFF